MTKIKKMFIRGLLALIPIAATFYILYFFFTTLDSFFGEYIELWTDMKLPGAGLLATLILIFLTGFFITNVVGEKLLLYAERVLQKIPIVTKIYFGIKQIIDAFSIQGRKIFEKVVLIEYPRKGAYVVGFATGECEGEVQVKTNERLVSVFIPTTPNPTSGMLILVPDDQIIHLDMNVEEGLKLIVSAGVVVPDYKADKFIKDSKAAVKGKEGKNIEI